MSINPYTAQTVYPEPHVLLSDCGIVTGHQQEMIIPFGNVADVIAALTSCADRMCRP